MPMVYGMEGKFSAGSRISPLTCQLDENLFDSLTARLTALNAAGEKKLLTSTPIFAAVSTLKSTILSYSEHRTILIESEAVQLLIGVLNTFYQSAELQLEAMPRQELLSKWDTLAHKHIVREIEIKTQLKCAGLFDDPEIFFDANSALLKQDAREPVQAVILGTYYLKQMNRLRIWFFSKKGLIELPNENF